VSAGSPDPRQKKRRLANAAPAKIKRTLSINLCGQNL
jgi:hypothetical protein